MSARCSPPDQAPVAAGIGRIARSAFMVVFEGRPSRGRPHHIGRGGQARRGTGQSKHAGAVYVRDVHDPHPAASHDRDEAGFIVEAEPVKVFWTLRLLVVL
jgi:hypothetical protein